MDPLRCASKLEHNIWLLFIHGVLELLVTLAKMKGKGPPCLDLREWGTGKELGFGFDVGLMPLQHDMFQNGSLTFGFSSWGTRDLGTRKLVTLAQVSFFGQYLCNLGQSDQFSGFEISVALVYI